MDEKDREWIEDDIIGATNIATGMGYASIALVLALIDKGAIDPGRLRDIIASLRTVRELDFELQYGQLSDATLGLDQLEGFLTGLPWKQGQVVELLQLHETMESARAMLRHATRKPPEDE